MEQQNESDFGLAERKVLLDLEAGGRPAKKKPSKVIKRPSAKDRKINVPLQCLKSTSAEQSPPQPCVSSRFAYAYPETTRLRTSANDVAHGSCQSDAQERSAAPARADAVSPPHSLLIHGSQSEDDIVDLLSENEACVSEIEQEMSHRDHWLEDGGVVVVDSLLHQDLADEVIRVGNGGKFQKTEKGFAAHVAHGVAFSIQIVQFNV